jgi:hypothetical protein
MLKHALLITVLGFLVPVARADTFDMTQIALSFEQFTEEDPSLLPRFAVNTEGPNASLSFFGAVTCNGCQLPVQFFNPGTRFSPDGLFLNPDGNWYGELGGLVFDPEDTGGGFELEINTFGSFVFPRPSFNTFAACVPAANTRPSIDLFGRTTSGNFVQDIVVNLPTNTGKYCSTWSFGTAASGESGWFLDSGSFTATVIPEPGTLTLAGSGLLTLATIKFRSLRRKNLK